MNWDKWRILWRKIWTLTAEGFGACPSANSLAHGGPSSRVTAIAAGLLASLLIGDARIQAI